VNVLPLLPLLTAGAAIRARRRQALLSAQATFLDDELARSRVGMLTAAATQNSIIEGVLLSQVCPLEQGPPRCTCRYSAVADLALYQFYCRSPLSSRKSATASCTAHRQTGPQLSSWQRRRLPSTNASTACGAISLQVRGGVYAIIGPWLLLQQRPSDVNYRLPCLLQRTRSPLQSRLQPSVLLQPPVLRRPTKTPFSLREASRCELQSSLSS
jgi:hypothetical protein